MNERYKKIIKEAQRGGSATNLEYLCDALDLVVRDFSLNPGNANLVPSHDGWLAYDSSIKKYVIYINVERLVKIARVRFTVAHEISHFILHGELKVELENARTKYSNNNNIEVIAARTGRYTKYEREANSLAAEILMPEVKVVEQVNFLIDSNPSIALEDIVEKLADHFNVSPSAMGYRLSYLGVRI